MHGQDWETVILKKPTKEVVKKTSPSGGQKKQTSFNSQTVKSDVPPHVMEKEDFIPKTVTSSMAQQIIQARLAKKWNQEDLARASQVPISIIKSYEQPKSTTVIEQGIVQKLTKALGVQIKK